MRDNLRKRPTARRAAKRFHVVKSAHNSLHNSPHDWPDAAVAPVARVARQAVEALEERVLFSTYTVTSAADLAPGDPNYAGTLRWAVDQANAANAPASSPSAINFSPGVFGSAGPGHTITLTQGELELTQGATSIAGPGSGLLTISGNKASRVLQVDGTVTASVSGLTVADGITGAAGSSNGGGIDNFGTLTVTACAFNNDNAGTGSANGGAIDSGSGTLTVTACAFTGDSAASSGGAIYDAGDLTSTLTVTACTFTGDSAAGPGGGISVNGASATVAESTFSNDTAAGVGGGLGSIGGTVTVTGSTFTGDSGYNGGAMCTVGGTLTVTGSTLSGGSAGYGGGIYNNQGTVTVTDSTITANTAVSNGGGVAGNSAVAISGSTITGNTAGGYGGGLLNVGASDTGGLTVTDSTVSGNKAARGGGVANGRGSRTIVTGSTISGNTASYYGGGLGNYGDLTVTSSTVSANSAGQGGGVFNRSPAELDDTIVAGNAATGNAAANIPAAGPDLFTAIDNGIAGTYSGSNNLIGDNDSEVGLANGQDGNQVGTAAAPIDAKLAPLDFYGGPTETMLPLPGSPAIDKGNNAKAVDPQGNTLKSDQRGLDRFYNNGTVDIGAVETQPVPLVVSTTSDDPNAPAGAAGRGGLSLRSAVTIADFLNAPASSPAVITFSSLVFGSSPQTITLARGPLELTSDAITVTGPGASLLTISGNHAARVLQVDQGATASLSGLTIANGNATQAALGVGGGIYNIGGTLTLTACAVSGNSAATSGGGIFNQAGTLTIANSTLSGDSAPSGQGGGISNVAILTVIDSTFAGDSAGTFGGGIYDAGQLSVSDSTLSGNSAAAGGGIYNDHGPSATLTNTIVAANTATGQAPDLDSVSSGASNGTFFGASNLIGDGSGETGLATGTNGNQTGASNDPIDPKLAPLAYNGGPTQTMALRAGSPAIDKGNSALVAGGPYDQRGSGHARIVGAAVDIGAFEVQPATTASLVVNTTADDPAPQGKLTLRDAINLAATLGGPAVISFDPNVFGTAPKTITLTQGELEASSGAITITGPGANLLTIDGNKASRVLLVDRGVTATVSGLTIADGHDSGTVTTSTFSADSAARDGGAVYNGGTMTLLDSTVSANTASHGGGVASYAPATLDNSLVAGNTATAGASAGPDLYTTNSNAGSGAYSGDNNLIGSGAGESGLANGANGNQVGTAAGPIDPKLGPLANNGGPTQTMALLPGSPAIDKGVNNFFASELPNDQRGSGYARIVNGMVDIGAYEQQETAPVLALAPQDPRGGGSPAPQRSVVTQIVLTFSQPVRPAAGDFRLFLANSNGSGANNGSPDTDASAALGTPINPSGDGVTWVVPFLSGTPFTSSNGLNDGIYHFTLAVPSTQTTGTSGGLAFTGAATQSLTFHRLFGDVDGNKTINALDYARFKQAFGSSAGQTAYNPDLDADGNGTINALDYAQFKKRFGLTFT